jgi:hypothetical protein
MAIPWPTNLLHFHLNKLFTKWFLIWHYFVWQLIWLLFKKLGDFFQIIWSTWLQLCRVFCCDGAVNVAHVNGPFEWPGNVDK